MYIEPITIYKQIQENHIEIYTENDDLNNLIWKNKSKKFIANLKKNDKSKKI